MSSHSRVVLVFVIASIDPSSSILLATRCALTANLELVFHSDWPRPSDRIPKRRSLPPPNKISPSLVL